MLEALTRCLFHAIGLLPMFMVRGLGCFIGQILWLSNGREARVSRRNIELCFPDMPPRERDQLVKRSLLHSGQSGLELIKVWMQPNRRTAARIKAIRNETLYHDKLSTGKGVLLLAPHLGNWEVVGLWCATHRKMTALYQPPKQAWLEPVMKSARARLGNELHPTDTRGVRALLKALKGKGMTAILPDQEPDPEGGVFAPFFGVQALTMTLVHGLVSRTGCEVLMAYAKRVAGGWEIVFKEADPDIGDTDVERAVAALNHSVETCIRDCPEQYHWEYKRFKKRPQGMPKLYD